LSFNRQPEETAEKGGLAPYILCLQSDTVASRRVPVPLFQQAPKETAEILARTGAG